MKLYLLKSINILNLLLGAALLLILGYLILPLSKTGIVTVSPQPIKQVSIDEETPLPKEDIGVAADYTLIADRNLFHPERIIPVEKKAEEKPQPKPDFALYGTLIDGDRKIAFMDDIKVPHTTPGRGKRQRVILQGGSLSGYVLSEVHEDRIVMTRGEDKIIVQLEDRQFKRSGPIEITAPAVTAPAAGQKSALSPTTPRAARSGRQPQQPAAQQAQPYRQYQPEALRRSMRSIKQQPPRTALPAQAPQPTGNED